MEEKQGESVELNRLSNFEPIRPSGDGLLPQGDSSSSPPLRDRASTVFELGDGLTLKCSRLRLEWSKLVLKKAISSGSPFKRSTEYKTILNEVSGAAEPGELLAIMGPSGGGKTSLLNTLSRRTKLTSGLLTLNGKKLPRNFNKIAAYVMQDDRLFEVLTPREIFQFSANLRLPRNLTSAQREKMVDIVINKLKMNSCANTRVGGKLLRGLSGGERKRTAIGSELITNPSLIFLDEPTTGLDSSTAFSLLQTLRDLAQEGHTVVCTIHQPSSEIFRLFDKLNLLVRGEVAYFGPGSSSISFFSDLGFPCPTYTNPADFFMDLLQTQTDEQKARAKKIVDATRPTLQIYEKPMSEKEVDLDSIEPPQRPPFYVQFFELTRRSWRTVTRNPLSFHARLLQYIVVSLCVGAVYWDLDYSQHGISNRKGALFFIGLGQILSSMNSVLLTFPLERALLTREQNNGMYGVTSYFIGKFLSALPLDIFFPTFFACVTYWMVNLTNDPTRFFLYWLNLVGLNFAGASLGLLLGCMLPNAEVAVSLAPVIIIPFMLFAGYFVTISQIPVWLRWLQYLSLFKWSFQALTTNEFHDNPFMCQPDELITVNPPPNLVTVCPITNGNQVLQSLGYSYPDDYWEAIGVIFGLFVAFRFLAYCFLRRQTSVAMKKDQ